MNVPGVAEMSERVGDLDHEAAHWIGRTVGGFIQDRSFQQVATFIGIDPATSGIDEGYEARGTKVQPGDGGLPGQPLGSPGPSGP
jgi:hypothetical protein